MQLFHRLIYTVLVFCTFSAKSQIKVLYPPYGYEIDTSTKVMLSQFQLDSLKYDILYYRDMLEETKRALFLLNHTVTIDTLMPSCDTMRVYYRSRDSVVLLEKKYAYGSSDRSSYRLDEFYFSLQGKKTYYATWIIDNHVKTQNIDAIWKEFGAVQMLLFRSRYEYDENGELIKEVRDVRAGGAAHRVIRISKNKSKGLGPESLPSERIKLYEFWD